MVPSTLLGLTLFVVLLMPGLAYVLRHESSRPAREQSVFRDTIQIVFVSVVCLTVVGLTLAGAHWLFPAHTPDVGGFVRDPGQFAVANYVTVVWWGLACLAAATLIAAVAADPRVVGLTARLLDVRLARWMSGSSAHRIRPAESAWYLVFHKGDKDPGPIVVGARLDNGTYVYGRMHSFNVDPEESPNRDIVLSAPIRLVTADDVDEPMPAQYTVISGRNIVRLDVGYLPSDFAFAKAAAGSDQIKRVRPDAST